MSRRSTVPTTGVQILYKPTEFSVFSNTAGDIRQNSSNATLTLRWPYVDGRVRGLRMGASCRGAASVSLFLKLLGLEISVYGFIGRSG